MKVNVNHDLCIGCGGCTRIAEGVFDFNDDNSIDVNNKAINEDNIENVKDAIDNCPTEAIFEVDN